MTPLLGKKPARPDAYSFKLNKYVQVKPGYSSPDKIALPIAPAVFGHQGLIVGWGMYANDRYGDCVFAGGAHETMLWTAEANAPVIFTDRSVVSDYSAVTGFNPRDLTTDQGTDMEEAAKYRRKVGLLDENGIRHKIDAYLLLPGITASGLANDATQLIPALATSAYVFGAVGIGIQFPESAMAQFNRRQPWDVVVGSPLQGGHYVPLVGRVANGNYLVVTWGRLQEVTPAFLTKYVDEAVAYVSLERLTNGKTLEGFDVAALQADLAALSSPNQMPTPPAADPNVAVLDKWATSNKTKSGAAAAKAWQIVKKEYHFS